MTKTSQVPADKEKPLKAGFLVSLKLVRAVNLRLEDPIPGKAKEFDEPIAKVFTAAADLGILR